MIGDIQIKIGGTALRAHIGYDGILARGLGKLLRKPARSVQTQKPNAVFSISQTLEKITVVFEVPGYGQDDLLLEATPHSVRLTSLKNSTESRDGKKLDCIVPLTEAVSPERVVATLHEGLLRVEMAKAAWVQGKARRVPLEAGPSVAAPHHGNQPDNHAQAERHYGE